MPATKARRPSDPAGAAPRLDIARIRLDADGYDSNGAWYGTGQPVFLVTWPDGASQAIRAPSITAAREKAKAALAAKAKAADTGPRPAPAEQPARAVPRRPRSRSFNLVWRDWKLAIRQSFPSYVGEGRTHLEITVKSPAGAPIPITDTGYRSHFIATDELAAAGGAAAFVAAWLDREARSKAWAKIETKWRQLELELLPPQPKPVPPRRSATPRARRAGQGSA